MTSEQIKSSTPETEELQSCQKVIRWHLDFLRAFEPYATD